MVVSTGGRTPVLHLSMVVGGALRDPAGERLGRVEDLIVRLGEPGYPPITGFLVSVAGRQSYLAAERVADLDERGVTLRRARLDLEHFERRPEEVLLREDVLDHQLINVDGARLAAPTRSSWLAWRAGGGWWASIPALAAASGGCSHAGWRHG
jgi:hypothetical protein